MAWKKRLRRMLEHQRERGVAARAEREDVRRFLRETVAPALRSVAEELERHGRETEIDVGPAEVSITVYHEGEEEFHYGVKARTYHKTTFAFPEMTYEDERKDFYHRAEVYLREGSQHYGIMGYTEEQVIDNFMHEYDKQLRWQQPTKPRH